MFHRSIDYPQFVAVGPDHEKVAVVRRVVRHRDNTQSRRLLFVSDNPFFAAREEGISIRLCCTLGNDHAEGTRHVQHHHSLGS